MLLSFLISCFCLCLCHDLCASNVHDRVCVCEFWCLCVMLFRGFSNRLRFFIRIALPFARFGFVNIMNGRRIDWNQLWNGCAIDSNGFEWEGWVKENEIGHWQNGYFCKCWWPLKGMHIWLTEVPSRWYTQCASARASECTILFLHVAVSRQNNFHIPRKHSIFDIFVRRLFTFEICNCYANWNYRRCHCASHIVSSPFFNRSAHVFKCIQRTIKPSTTHTHPYSHICEIHKHTKMKSKWMVERRGEKPEQQHK